MRWQGGPHKLHYFFPNRQDRDAWLFTVCLLLGWDEAKKLGKKFGLCEGTIRSIQAKSLRRARKGVDPWKGIFEMSSRWLAVRSLDCE